MGVIPAYFKENIEFFPEKKPVVRQYHFESTRGNHSRASILLYFFYWCTNQTSSSRACITAKEMIFLLFGWVLHQGKKYARNCKCFFCRQFSTFLKYSSSRLPQLPCTSPCPTLFSLSMLRVLYSVDVTRILEHRCECKETYRFFFQGFSIYSQAYQMCAHNFRKTPGS